MTQYETRSKRRTVKDPKRKWDFKAWWFVIVQNLKGMETATRVLVGMKRAKRTRNAKIGRISKTTRIAMLGPHAKCVRCGKGHKDTQLTLDHIIPVSKGGQGGRHNCQVMCEKCNNSKADEFKRYHPKDLNVSIGDRLKFRGTLES